jgi:hypothetical protein
MQSYSTELSALIDKLLSKRPESRPTAKQALELVPKNIKAINC